MTYRIKVDGIVQGIGFRPFVAYIAEKFHLNGEVRNSGGIVTIFLNCDNETLDNFIQKLFYLLNCNMIRLECKNKKRKQCLALSPLCCLLGIVIRLIFFSRNVI